MRLGGRRRAALNEALHELRRPLQALALAIGSGRAATGGVESTLMLVSVALDRLDSEINGGASRPSLESVPVRPLLEASIRRWQARARLGGGELNLLGAEHSVVEGDPLGLSQALDNLIVNAIEHGGPSVEVGARREGRRVRITVTDSGRARRPASRRGSPAEVLSRLTGRSRRGQGLSVVRRIAAEHGGGFELRRSERGSVATLDLPQARDRA
jgi:signal transduction histidine kinase